MRPVFVVDACRSPLGRVGGVLAGVRPDTLAASMLRALAGRTTAFDPADVDDVVWGAANQAGEDNRNVARMALLLADWPVSVPGVTVNRLCASGMAAVVSAARAIGSGEAEVVVAGGGESMTRAPLVRVPPDRGGDGAEEDTRLGWRLVNAELDERFPVTSLGETAEEVADRYRVTRADQDDVALASHRRAESAWARGDFAAEVVPAAGAHRDEGIRTDTSAEALAGLPAVFRTGGSVTAGNSAQLSDGAAAVLLASEDVVNRWGVTPLARFVGSAAAGVHPHVMGMGPVPATEKLLGRTGWAVRDLDRVELNEAFASQVVAASRELGLDVESVNRQGGAIALGHPLGCTGARLVGTLAHQLAAHGERLGLATMCVGVGQGQSVLLEGVGRG
jgi:acetyl-CoA acetyltransferase family protein